MKNKKIAVNLLPFDERLTGTGYFFLRLFREVLILDKITIYELHVSKKIPLIEELVFFSNVVIIHHAIKDSKIQRIFYEQLIFPFKFKSDVLFSPSVAIPIFFRFSAKKYITTIHDIVPFVFKKYGRFQQFYVETITKLSALVSDKIITVSENSKNDIKKYLHISEDKIAVVYNTIVPSVIISTPINIKENYFITVSTVQPGKNLLRLIEAFGLFSETVKDYKLIIVGNLGWQYEDVIVLIHKLKLDDQVRFSGYVTDEELESLYRKAKALLYVSLYEGFGIPPLEAMNYNCPVVVSNISSIPEVVGDVGIYVDPYSVQDITRGIYESLNVNLHLYRWNAMEQVRKFDPQTEALKFLSELQL